MLRIFSRERAPRVQKTFAQIVGEPAVAPGCSVRFEELPFCRLFGILRWGFVGARLPTCGAPALRPGLHKWWRRGDSTSAAFAAGWTMPSSETLLRACGCGACYRADQISLILVPAQAFAVGESMSLYRAGLKLAFFLPLGVAIAPLRMQSGFTDVSSVISQSSRTGATLDRTPVRKR
jgi:hypothetical protein